MKVLVEHSLTAPFTGQIQDGASKSAMMLCDALGGTMLGTSDSTAPCIKSPVLSGKAAGRMDMKRWYAFLREVSKDYEKIYLNHPLSSQSLLDESHRDWMQKSIYINHDGSGWMVTGNAGLRLSATLRFFRSCGGKSFYLDEENRNRLEWVAKHPNKSKVIENYCRQYLGRINSLDFLNLPLFDGQFDQLSLIVKTRTNRAPAQGYAVSIGRPDKVKRLELSAKKAKKLGIRHIIFTMSSNTSSQSSYPQDLIAHLKELGSEVRVDEPHDKIMECLASADFLILSSKEETFCHVALEAVQRGVPVMALEVPPVMQHFPEFLLEWQENYSLNTKNNGGSLAQIHHISGQSTVVNQIHQGRRESPLEE